MDVPAGTLRYIQLGSEIVGYRLPPCLIDYVVAHELAHLREMNHSARFWTVVGGLYPDSEASRRELRACSHCMPIL